MLELWFPFFLALAVVESSVTPSLGANEVKWGLPDAVAVAGQLFEYELKEEDLTKYKVTEEDIRLLPDWIKWNHEKKRFEGFASSDLIGQETKIRVTSSDKDTVTDTFLVKVVQFKMGEKHKNVLNEKQNNKLHSSTVETVHCPLGFSVITSTVLIDADWESLTRTQGINLIYRMSTYLGLPSDALRLNAATETYLLDANALVAGPGNVVQPKYKGILCQWEVGCENVLISHLPVLELLEVASLNGTIAEIIGMNIIGWHITNTISTPKRLKRHAYLFQNYHTPTPVPSYPPPFRYPPSVDSPESKYLAPKIEITISTKVGTLPPEPTKIPDPRSTAPELRSETAIATETTEWFETTSRPFTSNAAPQAFVEFFQIEIKAGELLWYKIPSDSFIDKEDGYAENLQLSLSADFEQGTSWLKLNKTSQVIYGLPLNDNVGIYYFYITATDSVGQIAKSELEITVIESELAEKRSREFSLTLDVPYDRFIDDLEFRLSVLNKLGQAFGDKDASKIRLNEVSPGSVVIRWTNNSLPEDSCPNDDIIALQKLMVNPDGTLNEQFARKMEPYRITGIIADPIDPCPDDEDPYEPGYLDAHPMVSERLSPLSMKAGQVFWFKIPRETFYDEEDGFTDNLKLLLLSEFEETLPPSTWLKINGSTQIIYGLPLADNAGAYVYYLVAVDSKEQIAKTPLKINVSATEDKLSHEFSLTLDVPYEKFVNELDFRLSVVNKIGQAFGDRDARKVTLTKVSSGSTEISWTNNSLPTEFCAIDKIISLHNTLINGGRLSEPFVKDMKPYHVIKASGTPLGPCALEIQNENLVTVPTVEPHSIVTEDILKPGPSQTSIASNNTLMYVAITIVILVVFLLVLILICFVFYKRKRQRQQKQKEVDRLSGTLKGIPIIFADELEETPPPGAESYEATPASTLKSKKDLEIIQTVPPPEYPKSKAGSASSTLKSDIKKPLLSDSEIETTGGDTLPKREEFESSTLPAR